MDKKKMSDEELEYGPIYNGPFNQREYDDFIKKMRTLKPKWESLTDEFVTNLFNARHDNWPLDYLAKIGMSLGAAQRLHSYWMREKVIIDWDVERWIEIYGYPGEKINWAEILRRKENKI